MVTIVSYIWHHSHVGCAECQPIIMANQCGLTRLNELFIMCVTIISVTICWFISRQFRNLFLDVLLSAPDLFHCFSIEKKKRKLVGQFPLKIIRHSKTLFLFISIVEYLFRRIIFACFLIYLDLEYCYYTIIYYDCINDRIIIYYRIMLLDHFVILKFAVFRNWRICLRDANMNKTFIENKSLK